MQKPARNIFEYPAICRKYGINSDGNDIDFWARVLQNKRRVLELGCGDGRIREQLQNLPLDLYVGIDNAEKAIETALKTSQSSKFGAIERSMFINTDMARFTIENEFFDVCFMTHNTLALLTDPQKLRTCLLSVRRHLYKNGVFVCDLENLFTFLPRLESGEFLHEDVRFDYLNQVVTVTFWEDGDPYVYQGRVFSPHEIRVLLESVGYETAIFYGDYDFTPFTKSSRRMIVFAR